MSIYKRGNVCYYEFEYRGERIQRSTRQGNRQVARDMQAAHRSALAKGEAGIFEREPSPTLQVFSEKFTAFINIRCAARPGTVAFYKTKLARILKNERLAAARLDRIDEALIEGYVQARTKHVSQTTVNRELATLRRLLRLAVEWKVLDRPPKIRLLTGEHVRDYVLSYADQVSYLRASPQPLADIAVLILETGLRLGEALALEWPDVRFEPVGAARFGVLRVRKGKTKNARRFVPLTQAAGEMLRHRAATSNSPLIFASERGPYLVTSIDHLHAKVRQALSLPKDFVIHSLRHTMLTRLGEAGAEAFHIMKLAGHSSVVVSQRYVHPTPEGLQRVMEQFQAMNQLALSKQENHEHARLPAELPSGTALAAVSR